MAFSVEHFHDLTQLLEEHPDWRAELRRLVLTDEILSLPQAVRELTDAQRRTEERLDALVEAQRRTEERLARLEAAVEALTQAQRHTEERVNALAQAQLRTEERLDALAQEQRRMADTVASIKGWSLEQKYRDKALAYFGKLVRRTRVVPAEMVEDTVESKLNDDELNDVLLLDLVVRGRPRLESQLPEVWLAVEVSAVVDRRDVERAIRRAKLLQRAGCRVVPVVAGEGVTEGGEESAREEKVALLKDGGMAFWKDAFSAWAE